MNTFLDQGLVYFHNKGELLQKYLRNPHLLIKTHKDNVNIELGINILSILESQVDVCSSKEYDECVMQEIRKKFNDSSCWPSFLENSSNSTCQDFEQGIIALSIFNEDKSNCKFPCYQINVNSKFTTTRPVVNAIHPHINFTKNPGYVFHLPKKVKILEMVENYGVISFMAEFGGWSGLFVGISVISVIFGVIGKFDMENKMVEKVTKYLFVMLLIVILVAVCVESLIKLYAKGVEEKISFIQNYYNICISICNEESPIVNNQFMAKDWQFWNSGSNISTMIRKIDFIYTNNQKRTLQTTTFNQKGVEKMSLNEVTSQYFINNNGDVEFCHTIQIDGVRSIKIAAFKVSDLQLCTYMKICTVNQ